ncbi:MAG: S41 family peptidase [Christensenellales bacterium]|jgi:carboxyl-terminal processing protease
MYQENQWKSKKSLIVLLIVAVAITSVLGTVVITNILNTALGSRVSISREDYDRLVRYRRLFEVEALLDADHLYDADPDHLVDYAVKGLVAGMGDPYAYYYTPEENARMQLENQGVMAGIGVLITIDKTDNRATILRVYPDTPAEKSGVLKGDKIIFVDDQNVEGLDASQVATLIRGQEDTPVKIRFSREGELLDINIVRSTFVINRISSSMLEGDIGYIAISEFTGNCVDGYKSALSGLKEKGMKALIIDLRDNPGGYVDDVCKIADTLLPEGKIVYTEDNQGEQSVQRSDADMLGLPLVVLINGNSASASEILAGAVQDYGVGVIVGTRSFGKGLVQISRTFESDGAAVKYTYAQYFTPNGRNIHTTGIDPDVLVEMNEQLAENPVDITLENDTQLLKAVDVIKGQLQ